jgi:hypothetical protein
MKTYHVAPRSVWFEHTRTFHASHYIDLDGPAETHPDGDILVMVVFNSEEFEETWFNHPDVIHLPHPNFEGLITLADHQKKIKAADQDAKKKNPNAVAKALSDDHHAKMAAKLGVDPATDTVIDIARKCGAEHRLMKLTPF